MAFNARLALTKTVYAALYYTGVHRVFHPMFGGIGTILMFHRVVAQDEPRRFCPMWHCTISRERFREVIHGIRACGYEFVSLDEVVRRIRSAKPSRKFVCLTFDDGFRDNLEIAYPICAAAGAPITIFVTTGFIDRTSDMWWYALEELVARQESIEFSENGRAYRYRTATPSDKDRAFWEICEVFRGMSNDERRGFARRLGGRYGVDFAAVTDDLALRWETIIEASSDPGVEFGAHTVTHPPLSGLSADEAWREMAESRAVLEKRLSRPVRHFAYPYGDAGAVSQREVDMCRSLGFTSGISTLPGPLTFAEGSDLHALPRICVTSIDNGATVAGRLSGLVPALKRMRGPAGRIQAPGPESAGLETS